MAYKQKGKDRQRNIKNGETNENEESLYFKMHTE